MHRRKIVAYKKIDEVVEQYRRMGMKIVLAQGTYDMVHVGHGRYLQKAKSLGDILVVGVDSDEKVKKRKGPQRPVVPEDERCEMLTFLSSVDVVVIKPVKAEKWELIKMVKPDVLIATKATYDQEELRELKTVCGEIKVMEPMATTSTSAKIRLVQLGMAEEFSKKLKNKLLSQIEELVNEWK